MNYLKKILPLLISILCFNLLFSQNSTGNIESYLNGIVTSLPSSSGNNYVAPTNNRIISWGNTITEILNGNIATARIIADSLNYQITEYTDTTINQLFYILEEKTPQINYWGIYVFNSTPCRANLILQAPHPKYDFNTGLQAIFCFKRLSAKALFLSGTHRCNHTTSSACSGSTSACNSTSLPFKISDMAHNETTVFQKTTEIIRIQDPNAVFVQLHGFSKTITDPYVIMSNGTRVTPLTDYVTLIKNELAIIDNTLTFKLAHTDLTWTKLVAFTNTQGRLINGSTSPCNIAISTTTGKFIHIEQEKNKLRQDSIGWNKMYLALSNVFFCVSLAVNETQTAKMRCEIYPNPTNNYLIIETENMMQIKLTDINGKIVFSKNYSGISQSTLNLSSFSSGLFFILIQTDKTVFNKKIVIK